MKFLFAIFSLTLLALGSCTSDTYDDLEEPQDVNPPQVVTYQDVRSIFEQNCISCHSNPPQNGAPMSLTSYSDTSSAVLNRGLLDRISRGQGEPGMMPNGGQRLPQQSIDLVYQWNEDGLLEN